MEKEHGAPGLDAAREAEKMASVAAQSENPEAAQELYETLMRLSREAQEKV